MAAVIALFLPGSLAGRIWYARSDGAGDAPTIQAAIDSTSAGDTVLVGTGTHEVEYMVLCSQKSDLTILGQAPEGSATIIGETDPCVFEVEWSSNITIRELAFSNCSLGFDWTSLSTISNCSFHQSSILVASGGSNEIMENRIISCGTGISCGDYATDISIHHNVIAYNTGISGPGDGYDILLDAGSYTIYNNIIVNNLWGIRSISTNMNLSCNDVWGNQTGNYYFQFFPDPTGANGNISADPQFCGVNPEISGNFYLQSDSPCAPRNHPDGYECGLIGRYPVGCGATSTEQKSWGGIKELFK